MQKMLWITAIGFLVAAMPLAFAQEVTSETSSEDVLGVQAGATPDSWTYGFKRIGETLQDWFTFDAEAKAKLKYRLAQIRLAEAALMSAKNKTELALRAMEEYESDLNETSAGAERLAASGRNSTELSELVSNSTYKHILVLQRILDKVPVQAKAAIEKNIERSLEKQSDIEKRFDRSLVNMTISVGNMTITRQVPAKMAENILEKASELRNRAERVNITNKEDLAKGIAEKLGIKKEKAEERIADANETIQESEEKISESGLNLTAAEKLLDQARTHLRAAQTAFGSSKYGEAFAQAVAAENLAENAAKLASVKERVAEKISEIRESVSERSGKNASNSTSTSSGNETNLASAESQ